MKMKENFDLTLAFVRNILSQAGAFQWSLQGFGMLRLHLTDEFRLNVWDSRYRVPNVSMIHSHPWDFESLILSGELVNLRYSYAGTGMSKGKGDFRFSEIIPGPRSGKGSLMGEVKETFLFQDTFETYVAGEVYSQKAWEIHQSKPKDGTITLNKRRRVGEDQALVFWNTPEWVSAEPRLATVDEVMDICGGALKEMGK